jgi:hypothetical protein
LSWHVGSRVGDLELAAVLLGALVAVTLHGGTSAPSAASPPAVTTEAIVRTDLQSTMLTAGTLTYPGAGPSVNQLTGIYTWLPVTGATLGRGATLYRVDNVPVVLMFGATPASRPFEIG